MKFIFENLDVYQRSIAFAHQISNLTETSPRGSYYLVDQLNRAALSISTNIAEGNGRFHKGDRANFFRIARGSPDFRNGTPKQVTYLEDNLNHEGHEEHEDYSQDEPFYSIFQYFLFKVY